MTKTCETCGHPIPDDEAGALLRGRQKKLYEIVKSAGSLGISSQAAMERLYADHPEGGPGTTNVMSVHASNANKKLRAVGLRIRSNPGPKPIWRLVRIA